MTAQTPAEQAAELVDALLAPCGDCGHWPGDHHLDTGCSVCRACRYDLPTVEARNVLASSWFDAAVDAAREQGRREGWDEGYDAGNDRGYRAGVDSADYEHVRNPYTAERIKAEAGDQ